MSATASRATAAANEEGITIAGTAGTASILTTKTDTNAAAANIAIATKELPRQLLASGLPLTGAQLAPQAKITLAQARTKALKAEPGAIVAQELEKEKGRLRYSFDIKVSGAVHEVGIDAITGKIVEDSIDDEKGKDESK